MKAKAFFFFIFLVICFVFFDKNPVFVKAESDQEKAAALQQKIAEYEAQISSLQAKQTTLSNQIAQFNAQISLTALRIEQTEDQISLLSGRIGQLSGSVSGLTNAFNARVIETYKLSRLGRNPVPLMTSGTVKTALTSYEYLTRIQQADQSLLTRLVKAQTTYESQRTEQEKLQKTLDDQKKELDRQKYSKAQLLSVTQNDEKKYQQLLADAKAQLAAFKKFTSGATVLNNQTKCDSWGCYYNQRDSQWAYHMIGTSSENMKDVGCLITSMAMIASHYGKSLKPVDIAASSIPFLPGTAYMNQGTWSVNGVTMTRTRIGSSAGVLDSELASGKPVIVGVYGGPDHFIVIKRKDAGNYIMNDPFVADGSDTKFTDHYPLSAISAVDRVSVN